MNELMIFENPEFGRVRSVEIDGEPWLVGKDVAQALGYSDTDKAIRTHVDDDDKQIFKPADLAGLDIPNRGMSLINESGLYSLVLSSKLPGAKQFRRWVTSEVLPSIRKKGGYTHEPKSAMEMLRLQSQAMFELDDRMTALEYREDDKPLADALNAMAMQELSHVDALHAQVVRIIKDYRATGEKPPEAMMAIWDWEHGKAIDHQARVKSMIDMYKK